MAKRGVDGTADATSLSAAGLADKAGATARHAGLGCTSAHKPTRQTRAQAGTETATTRRPTASSFSAVA